MLVGESYGFHFGINFSDTVKYFHDIKGWIVGIFEYLKGRAIRRSIQKFDFYCVSIHNVLEHTLKKMIEKFPNTRVYQVGENKKSRNALGQNLEELFETAGIKGNFVLYGRRKEPLRELDLPRLSI